ncbi:MAG: AbrB/MazE/SpoVT family DNA-binding domain-containing protein [Rhodospirillales bacterium]
MRITSKGQVTIPVELREKTGLLPHTKVEFQLDGAAVRIVRAALQGEGGRSRRLIDRLRGSASVQMTTDEIMALTRGK